MSIGESVTKSYTRVIQSLVIHVLSNRARIILLIIQHSPRARVTIESIGSRNQRVRVLARLGSLGSDQISHNDLRFSFLLMAFALRSQKRNYRS